MAEERRNGSLLGGLRGRAAVGWWLEGSTEEEPTAPVLELAVAWGDQLLEAVQTAEEAITLGEAPGCTIAAPLEGRHLLARRTVAGLEVVAPPGARLERWTQGVGQRCEGPLLLGPDGRAVVRLGALAIALRFGAAVAPVGRRGGALDLAWARALSLSAMGAGFVLAVLGVTPPGEPGLEEALFVEVPRRAQWIPTPAPVPAPPPRFDVAAAAPEESGRVGRFEAREDRARSRHPGRKREADRALVEETALLGHLGSLGGAAAEVFSGNGLGGGINEALGGLTGRGVGDAHGLGGIGVRGTGPGGGGDGLHLGSIGTGLHGRGAGGGGLALGGGGKRPTRIPGATRVVGGLPKEVIGKVIESKWAQIRHCYESELQRDPSLQGKVAVLFTIDGTGAVSTADVTEDSVGDGDVARCIVGRLRRWRFPAPKGGGEVVVSYPWIFRAAGS